MDARPVPEKGSLGVLVVIDSLGFGGAERLLVSLLPELVRRGLRCEVAALFAPYPLARELEEAGVKVHRLGASHRWSVPEIVFKLGRLARSGDYDVLLGVLYFGQLYAMLVRAVLGARRKVVLALQSPVRHDPSSRRLWPRLRRKIQQAAGRRWADRIVALAEAVKADYEASLGWRGLDVIYNGIPTSRLPADLAPEERGAVRKGHGVPESEFLIVVAARYCSEKGHRYLLEALGLLKERKGWEPHFIAAGQGPLKAELEALRDRLGLERTVKLLAPLPQEELFRLMQAADAVALPSLQEPFGLAAIEGMALGIPTIITDHYGLREVDGGTQATLMVKPADPEGLAEALWRLRSDPALAADLKRRGRRRVLEQFDISPIAEAWAGVLRSVAGAA